MVAKNNLKMLDLCMSTKEEKPWHSIVKTRTWYVLPKIIFAIESLTSLRLTCCGLEQASIRDNIKFISLQELSLANVHANQEIIQNLISSCPLITIFSLFRCHGMKHLRLVGLKNLDKLKVCQNYDKYDIIKIIDIESPSLQVLVLNRCIRLRDFGLGRFRLSSHEIKTLKFLHLGWFHPNLDIPNLHTFEYICSKLPPSIVINTTSLQEATIKLLPHGLVPST